VHGGFLCTLPTLPFLLQNAALFLNYALPKDKHQCLNTGISFIVLKNVLCPTVPISQDCSTPESRSPPPKFAI
jgi:hypothetical protein